MNYAKQINDMVDTFTQAQQCIWNDWFKGLVDVQATWTRQSQQIAENGAAVGKQMMDRWLEASSPASGIEMFQSWIGTWQEATAAWQESVTKVLQIQTGTFKQYPEESAADVGKPASKASKEIGKPAAEGQAA